MEIIAARCVQQCRGGGGLARSPSVEQPKNDFASLKTAKALGLTIAPYATHARPIAWSGREPEARSIKKRRTKTRVHRPSLACRSRTGTPALTDMGAMCMELGVPEAVGFAVVAEVGRSWVQRAADRPIWAFFVADGPCPLMMLKAQPSSR